MNKFTGMIKASELRPGNLVLHKGTIIILDGIDKSNECVMVEDRHITIPLTDIEPISLDPDWLEKLGAKERGIYYIITEKIGLNKNYYRDATGNYDGFSVSYSLLCMGQYEMKSLTSVPPIRFVHRLQNIFADLTEKELTIKETV